jgi:hypothetical protein
VKWLIGRVVNRITGERIPDLNSGLRVFRRRVIDRLWNVLPDGFSFTTTITLAMITNGYRVSYVPTDYMPRVGRSKFRPFRDTLRFVELVLRLTSISRPSKSSCR